MKKFMAIIMALVLAIGISGCGQRAEQTKGDGEVETLVWLVPGDRQADIEFVMEEANEIIEREIGAKLDLQFIDTSSYNERMKMYMASQDVYDLCFTGYLNDYQAAATDGGLMDMTDLIDKYAPNLRELIPEYVLESAEIDGRIYGVPNMQVLSNPICLITFADIADKYDFDFSKIEKMSDIEPYLEMIKKGETNIYPYRPGISIRGWWFPKYDLVLDGTNIVIRKDGSSTKLELLHETKEYMEGINQLRDWYEKGYIRADVASAGDDNTDLRNGKYIVFHGSWKPGADVGFKNTYGRDVITALLHEPYVQRTSALLTMISIGGKSKNPEKAIKFIELINSNVELYNIISFGIEGRHYNLNNEGKVQYIDNSGYAPKADWKFGNQFNALLVEGMEDDVYIETERMNEEAKKSILLGFVPDTTNITNEISQISSVNAEFSIRDTGADDPQNYWDTYIRRLQEAGQQKVLEELQRQVDEFIASR